MKMLCANMSFSMILKKKSVRVGDGDGGGTGQWGRVT